jgi:hypothetical protein
MRGRSTRTNATACARGVVAMLMPSAPAYLGVHIWHREAQPLITLLLRLQHVPAHEIQAGEVPQVGVLGLRADGSPAVGRVAGPQAARAWRGEGRREGGRPRQEQKEGQAKPGPKGPHRPNLWENGGREGGADGGRCRFITLTMGGGALPWGSGQLGPVIEVKIGSLGPSSAHRVVGVEEWMHSACCRACTARGIGGTQAAPHMLSTSTLTVTQKSPPGHRWTAPPAIPGRSSCSAPDEAVSPGPTIAPMVSMFVLLLSTNRKPARDRESEALGISSRGSCPARRRHPGATSHSCGHHGVPATTTVAPRPSGLGSPALRLEPRCLCDAPMFSLSDLMGSSNRRSKVPARSRQQSSGWRWSSRCGAGVTPPRCWGSDAHLVCGSGARRRELRCPGPSAAP